jgi:hypothetical protein
MVALTSEVKCLVELDEKQLIEKAVEYLQPVKLVETQIKSIEQEINLLRCNMTTIGAIDYSKDRVSGGGTPQGLDGSMAKFLDTVAERNKRIDELTDLKCDAIKRVDALDEKLGAIILRYEFILNNSADEALKMLGNYSERQVKRYKQKALLEFGKNLSLNVPKCP